jgi:hypothetical protein
MNFAYTDLPKQKNFIGFESGIFCTYPTYEDDNNVSLFDADCSKNEWYQKTYLKEGDAIPDYYDPRCRPWYKEVYKSEYLTMTDIYPYANGQLGISDCVPIWTKDHQFIGAYCFDLYPTSKSTDYNFISEYYQHDSGIVDYLVFTEDAAFQENDLNNSTAKEQI